jgi:hypothetical protein
MRERFITGHTDGAMHTAGGFHEQRVTIHSISKADGEGPSLNLVRLICYLLRADGF